MATEILYEFIFIGVRRRKCLADTHRKIHLWRKPKDNLAECYVHIFSVDVRSQW